MEAEIPEAIEVCMPKVKIVHLIFTYCSHIIMAFTLSMSPSVSESNEKTEDKA